MRGHTIVRTGLYSFAAGAVLVLGGVAGPASASPAAVLPALATDCDVPGGQPGGEHAPGGHDGHDMTGETAPPAGGGGGHAPGGHDGHDMTGGAAPPAGGGGGHDGHDMTGGAAPPAGGDGGHGSHGASATAAVGPSDGTRQLVLGGFTGVNGVALGAAMFLRRRTASRRGRHLAARAAARPARAGASGDQR